MLIPCCLALATFWPALNQGWVNFDDNINFTDNLDFRTHGWTLLHWASTTFRCGVYQPLAWLLFAAQYRFWGLEPGGYHLVSLLLHAVISTLVSMVILRVLRAERAPHGATISPVSPIRPDVVISVLAGALFGVHPLRTEVVAWVSCQPYLLCSMFYLASVLTYLSRDEFKRLKPHVADRIVVVLFALALLCKAAAVSLPAVLLLLDLYPLRRLKSQTLWTLVIQKTPLWLLSACFSTMSILARGTSIRSADDITLVNRLFSTVESLLFYAQNTLYPMQLAVLYPRTSFDLKDPSQVVFCLGATALISYAVFRYRRSFGLWIGSVAFLAVISPNIGLIVSGTATNADRYIYLPTVVICCVAASYFMAAVDLKRPMAIAIIVAAAMTVILFSVSSRRQLQTWKDSVALWQRAINVYNDSSHRLDVGEAIPEGVPLMYHNLGAAFAAIGQLNEAIAAIRQALVYEPAYVRANMDLAEILSHIGKYDEALIHWQRASSQPGVTKASELGPGFARYKLAAALLEAHRLEDAERNFHLSLEVEPNFAPSWLGLGVTLAERGRWQEALAPYEAAAKYEPTLGAAQYHWGVALMRLGQKLEAVPHLSAATQLEPENGRAWLVLGFALAQTGDLPHAYQAFKSAVRLEPGNANAHYNLGNVARRLGRVDTAKEELSEALRLNSGFTDAKKELNALE